MALKRTPAERHLLARICYRAAGGDGRCRDSNRELGVAIGVHYNSVSDMVQRLHAARLIDAVTEPGKANLRTITPKAELLAPYKSNADRYKSNADSKSGKKNGPHYKRSTDSTISDSLIPSQPNTDSDYQPNTDSLSADRLDPISQTLIAYQSNADSIYKEEKTNEKKENNRQQQQQADSASLESLGDGAVVDERDEVSSQKKEDHPAVAPNPPPPLPQSDPVEEPLPTSDEVRQELIQNQGTRRYAIEQLKVATTEADYLNLVEFFITQQEVQAKPNAPVFPVMWSTRRHFMNWLGKRTEIKSTDSNGKSNKRATGSLRPTALGTSNYRGTGSTCDVEL